MLKTNLYDRLKKEGRVATNDVDSGTLTLIRDLVEKNELKLKMYDTDIYSNDHSGLVEYVEKIA